MRDASGHRRLRSIRGRHDRGQGNVDGRAPAVRVNLKNATQLALDLRVPQFNKPDRGTDHTPKSKTMA